MTQNGPGAINDEDTSDRYGNQTKRKPTLFSVTHSASFNAIEPMGKENKTVK
jgi:hypothetical protein